jgi:hypothetical protein
VLLLLFFLIGAAKENITRFEMTDEDITKQGGTGSVARRNQQQVTTILTTNVLVVLLCCRAKVLGRLLDLSATILLNKETLCSDTL